MKAARLPLLVLVFFLVGCSNIVIEGQFLQPADATATALAVSRAAPTSTSDLAATAIERAVSLTLTAAVPSPTNTLPPSSTPKPTTAVPSIDTPIPTTAPTVTTKPTLLPTIAPTRPPTPQIIFLRQRCGTTYTIQADRSLEIRYGGWLAIGADLAKQNAQHLTVRLVLDGELVAGAQQPIVPGSTIPCGVARPDAYGLFYVAQVGPLSAGTHAASVTWILDEQVTDGGDVNGDGTPDLYGPGEVGTNQFTIIAQ